MFSHSSVKCHFMDIYRLICGDYRVFSPAEASLLAAVFICTSPVCLQSRLWRSHAEPGPWGTLEGPTVAHPAPCPLNHSVEVPSEAARPPGGLVMSLSLLDWSWLVPLLGTTSPTSLYFPQAGIGMSARYSPFPATLVTPATESPGTRWRTRGGHRHSGTGCRPSVPSRPSCRTGTWFSPSAWGPPSFWAGCRSKGLGWGWRRPCGWPAGHQWVRKAPLPGYCSAGSQRSATGTQERDGR